jgi:hypothetical protein
LVARIVRFRWQGGLSADWFWASAWLCDRKTPTRGEDDIFSFNLEIEWACNSGVSDVFDD